MEEIAARGDVMPSTAAHGNVWQRYAITVAARGAVLARYRSVSACNGPGRALIGSHNTLSAVFCMRVVLSILRTGDICDELGMKKDPGT